MKDKKINISLLYLVGILGGIIILAWLILGYRLFPAINLRNFPLYVFIIIVVSGILLIVNENYLNFMSIVLALMILIVFVTSSTLTRSRSYVAVSNMEERKKPKKD